MLRNNNKKFIKTLSQSCLKASRSRNIIAVVAIILTAMLFTSVATILQGSMYCIKEQAIRQSGTKAMVSLKYMPEKKAEQIKRDPAFEEIGTMRFVGTSTDPRLERLAVNVAWLDETLCDLNFMELKEGQRPEKENEVAVDTTVLDLLDLPHRAGASFDLSYEVNGRQETKKVTVSGFWEGEKDETSSNIAVSEAFADRALSGEAKPEDGETAAGCLILMGTLKSDENISEQLDSIVKSAGYDPGADVGEKGFLRANVNPAYEQSASLAPEMIAAVIGAAILILVAGYLIIYNIFQISVLKDIRLYGQLKTIGTSPKQLAYIVKRQGLRLSVIGIPAGLILGWLLGNALLPLIMKSLDGRTAYFVAPNLWVMLASGIFALLTVWISCKKPGRTAARISPIEALRYNGQENSKKAVKRGKESKMRIVRMASANLTGNKGKTLLVVLSIALSIVIFNSILNLTDCFDKETYAKGRVAADFLVKSSDSGQTDSPNYMIPENFSQFIKDQPQVKDLSSVYYHHDINDISADPAVIKTRNGKPYEDENDLGGKQVYGFDENALKRCKVSEGKLDMKKFASGNYVLEVGPLDDTGQKVDADTFSLHPGDRITADFHGKEKTYEVMACVAVNYALLYESSIGDFGCLLLPKEQFQSLYPQEDRPIRHIFDAEKGGFAELNKAIEKYQDQPGANIRVQTRTSVDAAFEETRQTYSISGTVIAAIFGIIGLLNLLNVILTGAIARQREFAVMQSVGMTRKQLRRLFVLEGLFYAVAAALAGIVLSAAASVTIVKGLTAGWWFTLYHMTLLPACALAPVYLLAAAVISALVDRMWNKGSVVERLRRSK
ncbi:ABC transporter permease [Anaerovorax odorimutans]|uniref:ABC transporter permease n=1 Tax=Anaerovorax odorimutans TaxID=109327 RepID=A0ABT1RJZ7_9FIRM|nr:ABC transporter permease [Anaerovorax odorimutans]MCQ4635502.1 ABC transporter permease [Anaerovorax odorimutans]